MLAPSRQKITEFLTSPAPSASVFLEREGSKTGESLKTLRTQRPYEGMKIRGVRGITDAQKVTLKALGGVDIGN